jgi:hypothetical protein
MSRLKGYRTIIVNALAGLVAALELLLPAVLELVGMPEWRGVLPPGWLPYYALGLALANIWLRSITTTPLGKDQA